MRLTESQLKDLKLAYYTLLRGKGFYKDIALDALKIAGIPIDDDHKIDDEIIQLLIREMNFIQAIHPTDEILD